MAYKRKNTQRFGFAKRRYTGGVKRRYTNAGIPNYLRPNATGLSSTGSKVMDDLKAMVNPHYGVNKQPQVHDGSTPGSNGMSVRVVKQIDLPEEKDSLIFFFPSINSMFTVIEDAQNAATLGNEYTIFHKYHGAVNADLDDENDATTAGNMAQVLVNNYNIDKWRMVSAGLHLQSVQSDARNSGWWEACRINMPVSIGDIAIVSDKKTKTSGEVTLGDATTTGNWTIRPKINLALDAINDMANQNSYTSGDLKNIHDHNFNLRHVTDEHEWKDIGTYVRWMGLNMSYNTSLGGFQQYSPLQETENGATSVGAPNRLNYDSTLLKTTDLHTFIDTTMDCIVINIHATTFAPSLIADCVHNMEVVYGTGSRLKDYEKPHHPHDKGLELVRYIGSQLDPAGTHKTIGNRIIHGLEQTVKVVDKVGSVVQAVERTGVLIGNATARLAPYMEML